jgi:wobble nucleotide-excising tRNase
MIPQIGGRNIERVLCEGEQRLHALALFFAELETSNRGVVVFDDPVSSFDYNYIENYCIRLREYAKKHPSSQIIVLTHNWEFFVQLQTKFNQACMDSQLSVQVLENCAVVADYSEKTDVLKNEINDLLSMPSEPTSKQKEDLAGKMRRLIEAIVNTHVFCNQRHQFKQKSLQSSVFREFTKIVALLPQEATDLGDLYSKLSPAEHYDPRNAFINTDKAMFQTRYRQILAIEAAVEGRKP